MKKLGIVIGVILLVKFLFLPEVRRWCGPVAVRFNVRISDSSTKLPISNASVRVIRDDQLRYLTFTNSSALFPIVNSDANGLAQVTVQCGAGGTSGIFGKQGSYEITHQLLVEAAGYPPTSNALAQIVGPRRLPLSKRVIDVDVRLTKNP